MSAENELQMLDRPLLGTGRFFVSYDALDEMTRYEFDADVLAARMRIFMALAYQRISYYTPPKAVPHLSDIDDELARVCGIGVKRWQKIKVKVARSFVVKEGRWFLIGDPLLVPNGGRVPLSAAVRAIVYARDGNVCTYCGATEGDFEIDHIIPVSKGGSDELENLTVACKPCNRSKGNKTIEEWCGE